MSRIAKTMTEVATPPRRTTAGLLQGIEIGSREQAARLRAAAMAFGAPGLDTIDDSSRTASSFCILQIVRFLSETAVGRSGESASSKTLAGCCAFI